METKIDLFFLDFYKIKDAHGKIHGKCPWTVCINLLASHLGKLQKYEQNSAIF